ncbi:MAG: hypothetical protein IJX26_02420, partial [Clostridia bacterium]|nr:hypothetical protein [Clostridia bacterium]
MISRDFAQPKKEYLKKNKIALIIISAVVLVGLIVFGIFGLNGNPDFKGCNLVSINIGEDITNKEFDKLSDKIETILAENKLDLYSVQIKGEGINTTLDVKYLGKVSDKKFEAVKVGFVAELDVEVSAISENQWLEKTVSSSDYIYTAVAILLVVLLASLFVLFRHNLSYALSLMGASLMSAIALICVFAIFRFEVNSAFFFAVAIASVYSIFEALILFENMRNVAQNPKYKDDKQNQIVLGVKRSANRMQFTTLGLFAVGLIFVIFGTSISRQVAISLMFSIIAGLSSVLFILPLIYNLTIDKVKIRKIKP